MLEVKDLKYSYKPIIFLTIFCNSSSDKSNLKWLENIKSVFVCMFTMFNLELKLII